MTHQATEERGLDHLRLLATALAGRPVEVTAVASGDAPWTDGATVYLDPAAERLECLIALAVQASLVRAGSLDTGIMRLLQRRRSLGQRYLALEGHRALAGNLGLLPVCARSLIDHSIAAQLDDAATSLAAARARRGRIDMPLSFGELHPREVLATTATLGTETPDLAPTDPAFTGEVTGTETVLAQLEEDLEEDDPRDLGHKFSSPVGGGGPIGRLLQRFLGAGRSSGKSADGGPVGADTPTHIGVPDGRGRGSEFAGWQHADAEADEAPATEAGTTYPEWDVHRGRYRPDWCTVLELEPGADELRPMPAPDTLALRRPLARLGIGLERVHRMPQGDDLDIDAAVESQVSALAGSTASEDVYVETLRRRRDLAVLVLLDISGSAGEPAPGGTTVHEHQRTAAGALTAALHELGDRVALHAFNSRGRMAVQMTTVKRFDQPFDSRVLERLGGLVPAAYTRLGAAIRHGAGIVDRDGGTPRRLLVVVSDGFAYDTGYEGAHGEADARRALDEARRSGVGCVCVSVGSDTDAAALRRVFGTAAHASVPMAGQLASVVAPLFRSAIQSAEAQRRIFQRTERTHERLDLESMTT